MKLNTEQANRFLGIYKSLLQFIFTLNKGEEIESLEDYLEAREILFEDVSIVDKFIGLAEGLKNNHIEVLENIKKGIRDTFVYVKTLKKHSIFMSNSNNQFYCVQGITDSINEIVSKDFSLIETAIIDFENVIICDGLFLHQNVSIGPNIRKDMHSQYISAKKIKS